MSEETNGRKFLTWYIGVEQNPLLTQQDMTNLENEFRDGIITNGDNQTGLIVVCLLYPILEYPLRDKMLKIVPKVVAHEIPVEKLPQEILEYIKGRFPSIFS